MVLNIFPCKMTQQKILLDNKYIKAIQIAQQIKTLVSEFRILTFFGLSRLSASVLPERSETKQKLSWSFTLDAIRVH